LDTIYRVPLKDAWACTELHGCELRCMGAHGSAWTCTTAKGHAVAGAGFKPEALRQWTGVSKKLLWMIRVNTTWNGAAWMHSSACRRMETHPAECFVIVCFTVITIIINICTETYNYATADYHSFSQSVNQAMRTVSARPRTAVHAHVPQFATMRCNARPCVF